VTVPSNPLRVSAKLREIVIKFSAKLPTINHFELDPELLWMQVISPIATPLDSPRAMLSMCREGERMEGTPLPDLGSYNRAPAVVSR